MGTHEMSFDQLRFAASGEGIVPDYRAMDALPDLSPEVRAILAGLRVIEKTIYQDRIPISKVLDVISEVIADPEGKDDKGILFEAEDTARSVKITRDFTTIKDPELGVVNFPSGAFFDAIYVWEQAQSGAQNGDSITR